MQSIFKKKSEGPRFFGENRYWGILLVAPWLVGLILLKLIPILTSLGLSFTDFYLLEPKQYQLIGLQNYLATLKDTNAWIALMQTSILALIIVPVQTGAAIF